MPTFQDRDGRVRAIVRRKGHPPQSRTFARKSDAVKWARKVETDIDHGGTPQGKETTRQLLERYRNEVSEFKDEWKWEVNSINKLMKPAWTALPAAEASDAISAWTEQRRKSVSNATVNRELNVLSAVFTYAIKRWRIKLRENPIKTVARPPKTKARKRRIAPKELARIWAINRGRLGTIRWYLPVMFEFAIETALRTGELVALQWEDVHMDDAWIYVRPGKNGDDRQVPMSDRAVELLKMLPKDRGGVFPVNAGSFGVAFHDVCVEEGISGLHFHDTRHEAVSRLAKIFPIMQLAAVIGHRDLKSLQVYYNPTIQELAQHLRGATQPSSLHPSPTT